MFNWQEFFKISRLEVPKVISFMILAAVFQAGLTIGTTAGDTLFLSNIGVESLPYIYVVMPVIMALYASVFSYFISKLGIRRLMYISVIAVAGVSTLLFFALAARDVLTGFQISALYYFIKIFTTVIYIAFYSLYWNFADLYFDMSESKRLYAYLAAGTAFGVIVGGLTVTLSAEILGVPYLFLLWLVLGLLSLPVIFFINRRFKELTIIDIDEPEEESAWTVLKNHWGSIVKIRYVSLLAGMVFLVSLLAGIAEYQYYDVFSKAYDEAQLAVLLGTLYAGVNVFNLIICAFVFNRLVIRIGVTSVSMIQPVVYILVFAFLLLDYGFSAAILAFFAYQGMAWSVDNNNYNLLYNALPNANRAQLRTILEGLLEPIATAIAGIYLLFYASRVPAEGISLVGFLGALALFTIVMFMKRNYLISLVQNLKTEWLDFSKKLKYHLGSFTDSDRDTLFGKLSDSVGNALSSLKILHSINDPQTLPVLLRVYDQHINYMGGTRNFYALKTHFEEFLKTSNYHHTRALVTWFNDNSYRVHPQIAEIFAYHGLIQPDRITQFSTDSNADRRNIALVASLHSADLHLVSDAIETIKQLLLGDSNDIQRGLRALQFSKNPMYAYTALPYIHHAEKEVQLTALMVIKENVAEAEISFIQPILDVLKTSGGEIRACCIDIMSRINDPICVKPLILIAAEITPAERRLSEDMICGMGKLIIPIVVSVLSDKNAPVISRSMAAKVLYRVAPEHFELIYPDLIAQEIDEVEKLKRNELLITTTGSQTPEMVVLNRFYKDSRKSKLNLILEFLSTAGRLPAYELMINSLGSNNPKIRAFGLETLEQGVDKLLFSRLTTQLDNVTTASKPQSTIDFDKQFDEVIAAASTSLHPIEKSAALTHIWRSDKSRWMKLIGSVIRQPGKDLVRETTLSLLHDDPAREQHNFFDRLALLCETPVFKELSITHLEFLAQRSVFVQFEAKRTIFKSNEPVQYLFILSVGSCTLKSGSGAGVLSGKGDAFPLEALMSKPNYESEAWSENCALLTIKTADLVECSTLYPEVAIFLFNRSRG